MSALRWRAPLAVAASVALGLAAVLAGCATTSERALAPSAPIVNMVPGEHWVTIRVTAQGGVAIRRKFEPKGIELIAPGAHTPRFEAGSLAKPLVGLMLASLAVGDPALLTAQLPSPLGDASDVSGVSGTPIRRDTLALLATHHAGLPRVPSAWLQRATEAGAFDTPYLGLTEQDVRLAVAQAGAEPGGQQAAPAPYSYSNLGLGYVGLLLQRISGRPLEQLFQQTIALPAGLTTASLVADCERPTHPKLSGFARDGSPAPGWCVPVAMAGAAGLQLSAEDGAALLQLLLVPPPALAAAVQGALGPRAKVGDGDSIGLGFLLRSVSGRAVAWHSGATAGFRSFMAIDQARGVAVMVLRNRAIEVETEGWQLLLAP